MSLLQLAFTFFYIGLFTIGGLCSSLLFLPALFLRLSFIIW